MKEVEEVIYPPVAPWGYIGVPGEVLWSDKGSKYEGRFIYHSFWGWSNFIPKNPELFRKAKPGEKGVGALAEGRPLRGSC